MPSHELLSMSPAAFVHWLRSEGISSFHLAERDGRFAASHPQLEPLAQFVREQSPDFDAHEGFFFQLGAQSGILQGACIHRTCRGQAAGGVRFWHYPELRDMLRDGLRLSRGMTLKNALAGLWWGGGKGVMAAPALPGTQAANTEPSATSSAEWRRSVYEDFGELMTALRGAYVTAEDVGTCEEDMAAVFSKTRFTTCIPARLGGSGNPSVPTAWGVLRGMEAALQHLGMGELRGKTVAMQGLGHVGEPLLEGLAARGVARVLGADIDAERATALRQRFGDWLEPRIVERGNHEILFEDVDIVSPNATGGILSAQTIPKIRARIVCGAANNQLADDRSDDRRLLEAGVLYMPDFLVNRMGIVNCADEQYGYLEPDPAFQRHLGDDWDNSIYRLSLQVLAVAQQEGLSPHAVALRMATQRSFEPHPLTGHRGIGIIRSLVAKPAR